MTLTDGTDARGAAVIDRLGSLGPMARVAVGVVLLVLGTVLLFLPGPGLPILLLGVAFVLSASEPGRRVLKRIRLWARGRFGSERVREMEGRLPRDVIGHENTTQMRLDLLEHERRKRRGGSRRDRRRRE